MRLRPQRSQPRQDDRHAVRGHQQRAEERHTAPRQVTADDERDAETECDFDGDEPRGAGAGGGTGASDGAGAGRVPGERHDRFRQPLMVDPRLAGWWTIRIDVGVDDAARGDRVEAESQMAPEIGIGFLWGSSETAPSRGRARSGWRSSTTRGRRSMFARQWSCLVARQRC